MTPSSRKVVITQKFFDEEAVELLISNGCDVEIAALPDGKVEADLDLDDIKQLLAGARGWIVGHANVTRDVLAALPDLAIISRRGVGYEKVDTSAATEFGKFVTIAAGGNNDSVADQVIGMMISLGRRFREAQLEMSEGSWNILVGTELYRKTVGSIGFGRIGRSLAKRLKGFDTEILVDAPRISNADIAHFGVKHVDREELFAKADYVTIHAPLNDSTRHMVESRALQTMKSSAILINTARGGLVDDSALLDALKAGEIAGAGLDVFESEANSDMLSVTHELIALPNLLAAPHAGASTNEALKRTNMIAAQCVLDVIEGHAPPAECIVADGGNLPRRSRETG